MALTRVHFWRFPLPTIDRWCGAWCWVLLIIGIGTSPMLAVEAAARPNILLILADDLGYSDLGCYGGEIQTPNLDALARGGLRFTQFYNTARCWPSRAALLTGYYAQQVRRDTVPGVTSGSAGRRPSWARLLPELLRPQGYRSYHSGKWHLDGQPLENGFDHSYNLEDHDRYFGPRQHAEDGVPLPPVTKDRGYYSSTAITDHALKCLQEHARQYAAQPFFTYLAFTAPHFPLQAPAEEIAFCRPRYERGWDVLREERWQRQRGLGLGLSGLSPVERDLGPPYAFPEALARWGPEEVNRPVDWRDLTPSQREFQVNKMAIHAAMIEHMDREIGRVLAQIRAMGAEENTLVLFLSDNGASAELMIRGDGHDPAAPPGSAATFLCLGPGWSSLANTPFRRHKTWVHEGGIATPLIAYWPRGITARGELRHAPGHLIDLVPTLLEVAGAQLPKVWRDRAVPPAPGLSLVPFFAHDGSGLHEDLWWLHEENRALRKVDWKIVASGKDAPWELYNLGADRAETRNLAAQFPERVRELAACWTQHYETFAALAQPEGSGEERKGDAGSGYEIRSVEGWTVCVSQELVVHDRAATEAALELLQKQLAEIVRVVPAAAVAKLREVTLWFSPEYPDIPPRAEYHPDAGWLRANRRNPAMARGIEFTNVRIFAAETKRMPNFALHELAHAYHDRVLGFNQPDVLAAYERARASGSYEWVERTRGDGKPLTRERAYAMTDHKEYFAEGTEAFFSRNDFFPFDRAQLHQHDPQLEQVLERLWNRPP